MCIADNLKKKSNVNASSATRINFLSKKKRRWMHNLDVADFLIKYSIKSESALFVTEQEQRIVGENDLAIFLKLKIRNS